MTYFNPWPPYSGYPHIYAYGGCRPPDYTGLFWILLLLLALGAMFTAIKQDDATVKNSSPKTVHQKSSKL